MCSLSRHKEDLVIFVHVHYPEIWREVADHIAQTIDVPFRLIATFSLSDTADIVRPRTPLLKEMQIIQTENRGRDIRPFLVALSYAGPFCVGLKLHTKKSTHRLEGEEWRRAIISSLLAGRDETTALIAQMEKDKRLGLVGPQYSMLSIEPWMGDNSRQFKSIAHRLELAPDQMVTQCPRFIAGSMFWFTRAALISLVDTELDDLFEPESGQTDGTAAHAFERLFAPIAATEGRLTVTVDIAEKLRNGYLERSLEDLVKEATDIDQIYLLTPHHAARFLAARAPFLIGIYRGLPIWLRNSIRSLIRYRS